MAYNTVIPRLYYSYYLLMYFGNNRLTGSLKLASLIYDWTFPNIGIVQYNIFRLSEIRFTTAVLWQYQK